MQRLWVGGFSVLFSVMPEEDQVVMNSIQMIFGRCTVVHLDMH